MNWKTTLNKKGLSGLLVKMFSFILILFILDFAIGSILRILYFKEDSGLLYRTTYALDSTKADLLIFGSSTANHHYSPVEFEERMKLTTYNTGRDGNTIFYNYAVLQSVLKRYTPKIAILDFNIGEFMYYQESYDRISSLLPYYKNHPEIRPIIELKSPYEKYKLISKIYPFNSMLFTILVGNMELNKNRDLINDENGYVPLNRALTQEIITDTNAITYELDHNKIHFLKSFIRECKNAGIKLYIFISPRFIKYTTKDSSIEITHSIADEFNIPFTDFSKDTLFWNHSSYFDDETHLNDKGASVYSNKVIDQIMKYQQNDTTHSNVEIMSFQ